MLGQAEPSKNFSKLNLLMFYFILGKKIPVHQTHEGERDFLFER